LYRGKNFKNIKNEILKILREYEKNKKIKNLNKNILNILKQNQINPTNLLKILFGFLP
jgi:hypothetical protein